MSLNDDEVGLLNSVAHMWMAFSTTASLAAVVGLLFDHDNPLHSDDPYIVGALAGAFGAFFTLCALMAAAVHKSLKVRYIAYLSSVGFSIALLLLWDLSIVGQEGHGIPTLIAILTGGAGIVAYPILWLRVNWVTVIATSIPGILVGAGYLHWWAMR